MAQHQVLLMENDPSTRNALHGVFIRKGWEVAMVLTLAEGLALLRDYEPQWIITGSDLPDGEGTAVLRMVRAEKRKSRVAFVTASKDASRLALLEGNKPDLLLTRPVDPEAVFAMCAAGGGGAAATG